MRHSKKNSRYSTPENLGERNHPAISLMTGKYAKMEELLEILADVKDDVDFENCTTLIDDAVLDSFDILQIISALNDAYDISIPASEIVPKNFNSAAALLEMVERLQDA